MPPGRPSRAAIYRQLEHVLEDLQDRGGLPSPSLAKGIWRQIWFLEAHNSTALEGNTLVLQEVEKLLGENKAVGDKPLADYLEVKGYADAASWVYEQAVGGPESEPAHLLTVTEVRRVHETAMRPVWAVRPLPQASPDEGPGQWRRHNHEPFPGGMRTIDFTDVPSQVADWVAGVNALNTSSRDFYENLAGVHCRFEQVHPFIDGNGRAGRLVMNLFLVRLGYPPLVILKQHREKYLQALRRGDRGDFGPLGELLARSLIESAERFVVPLLAKDSDLVPLTSLESKEFSQTTLRRAVERGRLRAIKGTDGRIRSSQEWLGQYIASRWQREGDTADRDGIH